MKLHEKKYQTISTEQKYIYLEQIRDYTYKDVVLADTKAGFALTIVALSLAALASFFNELSKVKSHWIVYIDFCWISGLVLAGLSIMCAMLTILPRSYISHEIANDSKHWIHMNDSWWKSIKRRFLDALYVIMENFWQKQTKGTSQSLQMLINSHTDRVMINSLQESMQRALLVQNLKFLWVGKALLFAFLTFTLISMALFLTLVSTNATKRSIVHSSQIVDKVFKRSKIDNNLQKIQKNKLLFDQSKNISELNSTK